MRLAEQKTLQHGCRADDDIRQHAQLFERFQRQVLSLVDDQERAPSSGKLGQHKFLDAGQQRRLRQSRMVDSEPGGDHAQHVVATELARDDFGGQEGAWIDLRQQTVDQHRLAGADLPGYDDEPFGMMQTVGKMRHRPPMLSAVEEKPWVGRQLERQRIEPVKLGVHKVFKSSVSRRFQSGYGDTNRQWRYRR